MTKLKKAILASGLKQKWIAARIGMDCTQLSHYVIGDHPTPPRVIKAVAKLLKVSQKSLRA
jgi:hypothetical protein